MPAEVAPMESNRWGGRARRIVGVLVLLAAGVACGGGPPEPTPPPTKTLGEATADAAWDTQVLREASAASNEVVRNAADCDLVRPIIGETRRKLDDAGTRLRTHAGRATLDALHKQVDRVADLCG
jgi:hypothetical protein